MVLILKIVSNLRVAPTTINLYLLNMDIELGTSLSSGQSVNVLSIEDAPHSEDNACSEGPRITRELGEDAFPH
jgi:hypothetical protein